MKSILIMGGSDFIGSALAKRLIKCGYQIDILTNGKKEIDYTGFKEHLICDRKVRKDMENIIRGRKYDYIYDMTAYTKDDVSNLIDFVNPDSLKKYIVLSAGAVYKDSGRNVKEENEKGENENWGKYGLNKKEAEDFVISSSIPYIIIRPTYIYGENNNLYREYYFFEKIEKNEKIPVPKGKQVSNQFIYIGDLVKVLESIMKNPHVREAYNVTNPQLISWDELIHTCGEVIGKEPIIKYVDMEKVEFRERTYFPFRNIDFNLDINKLIEHGLYIPNVLLKEGLIATYKWFLANKPKMHDRKMDKVESVMQIV